MAKKLREMMSPGYYTQAKIIVNAQSHYNYIRTIHKRPKLCFEKPYNGEKILFIALWEKSQIRPDVQRLLKLCRSKGYYVLGVNTQKIDDIEGAKDLLDCYIERKNFGRDFGSYRDGFCHMFKRGWADTCPRVLMLNDSIYFSQRGLDKFLDDLMDSDIDALGATENFEIEHHLGSFCIAFSNRVISHPRFRKFWKQYRQTDVRPKVIKRGEMQLSKTLKRCVRNGENFASIYSAAHYMNEMLENNDADWIDKVIYLNRSSKFVDWPRFEPKDIVKEIHARLSIPRYGNMRNKIKPKGDLKDDLKDNLALFNRRDLVTKRDELLDVLEHSIPDIREKGTEKVNFVLTGILTEIFLSGSHIHQNGSILYYMGLPIIKLDILYRGMFNNYDLARLIKLLPEPEQKEVSNLIMSRPFGGNFLIKWKRAAFFRGLI